MKELSRGLIYALRAVRHRAANHGKSETPVVISCLACNGGRLTYQELEDDEFSVKCSTPECEVNERPIWRFDPSVRKLRGEANHG